MSKGSQARPLSIPKKEYDKRFDAVFGKKPECKCSLRTRLLGDGCSVCNPEYAKRIQELDEGEDDDYR